MHGQGFRHQAPEGYGAAAEGGIAALYLFGSYARDEAGPKSDIDVFVDPERADTFGLGAFADTYELIERNFPGVEIGYSTRDNIAPSYRPLIESAAIRVF